MAEHLYEIEITATNAAGDTSTVHAEYAAQSDDPHGAASEVFESVQKEHGKARARFANDER